MGTGPNSVANGVRPHPPSRHSQAQRRGLTPFARGAGNWGLSPFPFLAVARRKPTGLNVCRNGCAEMHCGGRSQSGSTLGRRAHWHRTVPACWRAWDVPIWPLLGEECTTPGLSKNQNTEFCDLFHLGDMRDRSATGNEAADRGGGGVRCGLRANGDRPHRVVRLSTADSLCDRMERGEEEAPTAAALHLRAQILQT